MQKIICITGPMAAGKNYVCSLFENKGWLSIDADQLVHSAIQIAQDQIFSAFEKPVAEKNINLKNTDGTLNRRALAKLIFPEPELLKKQEDIVYPILIQETKKIIQQNPSKNIILNATVLYKTPELLNLCSQIFFVTAPRLIRLCRARKRDRLPLHQIITRFKSQRNLLKNYKASGVPVIKIYNIGPNAAKKHIFF